MDWKSASDNEIVCYCNNISKKTIVSAINEGYNTLSKIKDKTTACTGGKCKVMNPSGKCCSGDILELIEIYFHSLDKESSSHCCCNHK